MVTSLWQPKTNYQIAMNHWTSTASHSLRHAGHDKFSSVPGQTLATYVSDCIKLTHNHLSSFKSCLSVTIRHKWYTKYSLFSFVDESINTSRRAWCHLIQPLPTVLTLKQILSLKNRGWPHTCSWLREWRMKQVSHLFLCSRKSACHQVFQTNTLRVQNFKKMTVV